MATALVFDEKFLNHHTGDHPESPERYQEILTTLKNDKSLWKNLLKVAPQSATVTDILRCHTLELVNQIAELAHNGGGHVDEDTVVSQESYDIALLSAGAAMTAVDEVMTGKANNAFSLARPPGHHATHDKAMGFCLFNNAAIAARYAQTKYQAKNILIIDWDVHHGNGTQDIFYHDPSVFYFSIHQFPFYPGTGAFEETGEGAGKGTILNTPVLAYTPAELYHDVFRSALMTIEKNFKPDLVIISAGFDARKNDPLGQLELLPKDYAKLTQDVLALAKKTCGGKVISVLEGGYLNESLGPAVLEHINALSKGDS
jgi:acetoin utilization deacetylase AcuC-like enzyme